MYIPDGFSTTLTTSVPDASAVVKPMFAVRSSSVTRNALPASNVVRCVLLLSKSSAAVSTQLPTSVTAVRNPAAAVPFPINIFTMPALHSVNMRNFALLPDRGSESGDPNALETGINGIERTSLYYCDPMHSNQKGGIEEVHTLLRMIFPFPDRKFEKNRQI